MQLFLFYECDNHIKETGVGGIFSSYAFYVVMLKLQNERKNRCITLASKHFSIK